MALLLTGGGDGQESSTLYFIPDGSRVFELGIIFEHVTNYPESNASCKRQRVVGQGQRIETAATRPPGQAAPTSNRKGACTPPVGPSSSPKAPPVSPRTGYCHCRAGAPSTPAPCRVATFLRPSPVCVARPLLQGLVPLTTSTVRPGVVHSRVVWLFGRVRRGGRLGGHNRPASVAFRSTERCVSPPPCLHRRASVHSLWSRPGRNAPAPPPAPQPLLAPAPTRPVPLLSLGPHAPPIRGSLTHYGLSRRVWTAGVVRICISRRNRIRIHADAVYLITDKSLN